jgi:hypothetical protein
MILDSALRVVDDPGHLVNRVETGAAEDVVGSWVVARIYHLIAFKGDDDVFLGAGDRIVPIRTDAGTAYNTIHYSRHHLIQLCAGGSGKVRVAAVGFDATDRGVPTQLSYGQSRDSRRQRHQQHHSQHRQLLQGFPPFVRGLTR